MAYLWMLTKATISGQQNKYIKSNKQQKASEFSEAFSYKQVMILSVLNRIVYVVSVAFYF